MLIKKTSAVLLVGVIALIILALAFSWGAFLGSSISAPWLLIAVGVSAAFIIFVATAIFIFKVLLDQGYTKSKK